MLAWEREARFEESPTQHHGGTSRTIDVLEKTFEKSLGIILETSCTVGNTYSELRRFAAHSRERGCPHANASWSVSVRPKIPPRVPKKAPNPSQTPPRHPKTPHRHPQDTPRHPKHRQDAPKTPYDTPKTPPRPSQDRSKMPPKTSCNIAPT